MAFEETTGDPLVNDDSDHLNQVWYTDIERFRFFSLLDSLEEESSE